MSSPEANLIEAPRTSNQLTRGESVRAYLSDFKDRWTPRFSLKNMLNIGVGMGAGAFPVAGVGMAFAQTPDQAEVEIAGTTLEAEAEAEAETEAEVDPNAPVEVAAAAAYPNYCGLEDTLPSRPSPNRDTAIRFNNVSGQPFNILIKSGVDGSFINTGSIRPWSSIERQTNTEQLFVVTKEDGSCEHALYANPEPGELDLGAPEAPWPSQIGDVTADKIEIRNMSSQMGVTATDLTEFARYAQRLAPNGVVFYFYDLNQLDQMPNDGLPDLVYSPQLKADVDTHTVFYSSVYPGMPNGRRAKITRPDGTFEYHFSLPDISSEQALSGLGPEMDLIVMSIICGKGALDPRCFGVDAEANARSLRALNRQGPSNIRVVRRGVGGVAA